MHPNRAARTRARRGGGRCRQPHGRLERLGARRDQPAGHEVEDACSCSRSPSRPRRRALTTTKIELTPPSGFAIDSFVPAPGWKRTVQQTGSGEDAVIQKVTWTGGRRPDRRGRDLPVPRQRRLEQDLHLHGPADLLGRLGRRLGRRRVVRHAGARRSRRSRRSAAAAARRWRSSRSSSAAIGARCVGGVALRSARREPAEWHEARSA